MAYNVVSIMKSSTGELDTFIKFPLSCETNSRIVSVIPGSTRTYETKSQSFPYSKVDNNNNLSNCCFVKLMCMI